MSASVFIENIISDIKLEAENAESKYDLRAEEISELAKSKIHLDTNFAAAQVVNIASKVRSANDELYVAYQGLIKEIDARCRPYINQDITTRDVCEISGLIKWLNEESKIGSNYSASFNGMELGNVASVKYQPSLECLEIEKFWSRVLVSMPNYAEEQRLYRERQREEQRQKRENKRNFEQQLKECEKAEKVKAERERMERQALRVNETNSRREYLREARKLIFAGMDAVATVDVDGKLNLKHTKTSQINKYLPMFVNLQSVACTCSAVVGLYKNGTCVVGHFNDLIDKSMSVVSCWGGIVSLAAGPQHMVGLRSDGTCISTPLEFSTPYGRCTADVSSWSNVKEISCGSNYTVGLRYDGTVLHTGSYETADCEKWTDVATICAGVHGVVGVTVGGKILSAGNVVVSGISKAENIVQLAVVNGYAVALQANGVVIGGKGGKTIAKNVVAISGCMGLMMLYKDGNTDYDNLGSVVGRMPYGINQNILHGTYDNYIEKLEEQRLQMQQMFLRQQEFRRLNLCQHCGGTFVKKLFTLKCAQCGKGKDY